MNKMPMIDEFQYKDALKESWKVPTVCKDWFLGEISKWISHHAIILGVPETYISVPLLVAVAYCSQHTSVKMDFHTEPTVLYGLVGGRSGTNKSASLQLVTDLLNNIDNINNDKASHLFDSGTMEGLMQAMRLNNGCILGCHDEFACFNDNLDKGSSGSSERARYLSLYSGSSWSRKTKTSGCIEMTDPRYSMIAFTQPFYATQFAMKNKMDGFFQRFLVSVPKETYIKMSEKRDLLIQNEHILDMQSVMGNIYDRCCKEKLTLEFVGEAKELYDAFYDPIVDFRRENVFEESRLSVKSKSLGLVMRVSGIICLLKNAIDKPGDNINKVTKSDFEMASRIVECSVDTAFSLLKSSKKVASKPGSSKIKEQLPEPENFSIDFAQKHQRLVQRILSQPSIPLSVVSRDKIYPVINSVSGSKVGNKFLLGLQHIGLGHISPVSKSFKRHHPKDDECHNRDEIRKKYKMLNLEES